MNLPYFKKVQTLKYTFFGEVFILLTWQIIIKINYYYIITFKNQQKVALGSSLSTPYYEISLINQTPFVK